MIHEQPPLDTVVLAHHGVKGMRWGVHKQRTAEQQARHNRNVKIATGVGTGVAVAGAAALSIALKRHANVPMSKVAETIAKRDPSPLEMMLQARNHAIVNLHTQAYLQGKRVVYDAAKQRYSLV